MTEDTAHDFPRRTMRNTKRLTLVTALVACLAIGSAEVATAKLKKETIPTVISVAFIITPANPPSTPASTTFSGQISAKGPSGCSEGRTVTISRIGPIPTDLNGQYSISLPYAPEPGAYTASVDKRVIKRKKKGKKFICAKAVTAPVTIP